MFLPLSFFITIGIEYAVLTWFRHGQWMFMVPVILGIHLMSHPAGGWLILNQGWNFWLVEGLIVVFEAILYWLLLRPGPRKALLYSCVANVTSIGVGYLVVILTQSI